MITEDQYNITMYIKQWNEFVLWFIYNNKYIVFPFSQFKLVSYRFNIIAQILVAIGYLGNVILKVIILIRMDV